tara:strand:+ start:11125 stop:11964 length:840 start_codon:yes stop_codon:yes gene_type:complete
LKTLLGIGTAGCNVVHQLSAHSVYQCYYISNEINKTSKFKFALPECDGPEEYESLDMSKLHRWLSKIEKKCTVFLCGASDSTGITLRALELLHKKGVSIDVVYFAPEIEVLSDTKALHERSVRGVLQNFSRSGLFEKICLVSNMSLETIAGSTNVYEYFNQINQVFTSTYHMMEVFKNTKPLTSTFKKPHQSCRISTIGLSSLDGEERLFFPLNNETEMVYYYGINEQKLKTEENLFRTITDKVKKKITKDTKVSFGIYPTQYENDYIYAELFSPKIQK